MSLKSHHVIPNSDRGGWDVKKSGADRAREISKNQGAELFIHNKDGQIASRDSHGNDPYPPKG